MMELDLAESGAGGSPAAESPRVEPGRAEMAFVVIDTWQGRGIGSLLMRHLVKLAGAGGLNELTAEVLPENGAMLKVFGKFGFRPRSHRDPQTIHLALKLG